MLKSLFRHAGHFLLGLSESSNKTRIGDPAGHGEDQTRHAAEAGTDAPKFLAGSIHFLNLNQIRQELGANWERASAAAHEVVRQTIERNLQPGDRYGCQSCDMYVLCFANRSPDAVGARMRAIESEIRTALAESRNDLFQVACDMADIDFVDGTETPVMETVAAALRQVRQDAEKAARAWREHFIRHAGVRFRPIWSPRKKVVAMHRTMLDDETGRQTIARMNALASIENKMDLLFDLDCVILGRATAGLHDLLSRGGRSQLIVPVNFNTLASRGRRQSYLKLCQDIPASFRRFLLFEISNIPPGTPSARLTELAVQLNAYAHGTFVEATAETAKTLCDGAGATIVGVVIHAEQFSRSSEPQARLRAFVTQSIARNVRVLLDGVDTEERLRIALAAGVDCLAGPSVAETVRALKSVHHWDLGRAAA